MKVTVVGGAGAFGSRLCTLLKRDGHAVAVAGRSAASRAVAGELGVDFVRVDLAGSLEGLLASRPDVIVDASGPFQLYGDDAYRLPRFCIANGIHYLDLSDDGAFTRDIARLDDAAHAAGVAVISGASSVPAISSAAVVTLAAGMQEVLSIESAIMPGNRAPRGRSVVASILSQVGRPMQVQRDGRAEQVTAWSERVEYELAPGIRRPAWLIGAPDLLLFPETFRCPDVSFRAGMESPLLNAAVTAHAWLARRGIAPHGKGFAELASRLLSLLAPGGTDVGGMVVEIGGRAAGLNRRRRWTLVARNGDGPYIPGIPVRALLRRSEPLKPGARACTAEITLAEVEEAAADLAISTSISEHDNVPVFAGAAGHSWPVLPPEIRDLHTFAARATFEGTASVERGRGVMARLVAFAMGFPQAGMDIPVRVTKTRRGGGETWLRDFEGSRFSSILEPGPLPGTAYETFGPLRFRLNLAFTVDRLSIDVASGTAFGIPMPRCLLPGTVATESVENGRFRFDVALLLPLRLGLIVRYRGTLSRRLPVHDTSEAAPPILE